MGSMWFPFTYVEHALSPPFHREPLLILMVNNVAMWQIGKIYFNPQVDEEDSQGVAVAVVMERASQGSLLSSYGMTCQLASILNINISTFKDYINKHGGGIVIKELSLLRELRLVGCMGSMAQKTSLFPFDKLGEALRTYKGVNASLLARLSDLKLEWHGEEEEEEPPATGDHIEDLHD